MDMIGVALQAKGIPALNAMQEEAVKKGLLEAKNIVVSSPTGSGKTLLAELAALNTIASGKKAVYTCPLRALASEQHETFSELLGKVNPRARAALSTGDLDSSDGWLRECDWITTTYEKLDSLIRHRAEWLRDVGLLVVDEIHEIDSDRGPTLEVLIAAMLRLLPNVQVLALSATIPNAKEIAQWLGAELVESDYRPVPLHEGVLLDGEIRYRTANEQSSKRIAKKKGTPLAALVEDSLAQDGQVLVFANSKKSAESTAEKLSQAIGAQESARLQNYSEKILNALDSPTKQCRALASLVRNGIAFHHAGLVSGQRQLVEDLFRKNLLKVIVATPTLSAGVNLPARRVVISTVHMFAGRFSRPLLVREYKQRAGRAGRPKYDKYGEAILLAKDPAESDGLYDTYVLGQPEPVESHLGSLPVLRSRVLASITTGFAHDAGSLREFFSKTFYAVQYGDTAALNRLLDEVVADLAKMGFLKGLDGKILPTALGRRVSELYIDPLSAHKMMNCLKSEKEAKEISYLHMISDTEEMRPYLAVPKKAEDELWNAAYSEADSLFTDITSWNFDDYLFLNKFRLALMLSEWMAEASEEEILERYGIAPGILAAMRSNADWILYSAEEIAKLSDSKRMRDLQKLRKRLEYGVKAELVPLVGLRNIGRVRGRMLYNAGLRTPAELRKAGFEVVARILGEKVAAGVIEQLKGNVIKTEEPIKESTQQKVDVLGNNSP